MAEVEEMQRELTAEAGSEAAEDVTEAEDGEIVEGSGDVVERPIEGAQHPLEHAWTFWFNSGNNRQAEWGSSMRAIHTFSTVEEFWCLYNNILKPSKLVTGVDFHFFKCKIEPKWEDPVCANGGKWGISCARAKADILWLYTLLAMIGEQFIHGDEICGAVVNVRSKQYKIAVWTKNAANEAAQVSIGKQWKEFLDYNETIGFVVHDDARLLDKLAKNRYTA